MAPPGETEPTPGAVGGVVGVIVEGAIVAAGLGNLVGVPAPESGWGVAAALLAFAGGLVTGGEDYAGADVASGLRPGNAILSAEDHAPASDDVEDGVKTEVPNGWFVKTWPAGEKWVSSQTIGVSKHGLVTALRFCNHLSPPRRSSA